MAPSHSLLNNFLIFPSFPLPFLLVLLNVSVETIVNWKGYLYYITLLFLVPSVIWLGGQSNERYRLPALTQFLFTLPLMANLIAVEYCLLFSPWCDVSLPIWSEACLSYGCI